jgi:type IV fimbrial biogenesis protein FimT
MTNKRHDRSTRRSRTSGSAGFTLVELMIGIVVLAILLGFAVPNFNDASLSARLNGFANSLSAAAQVARSEAVKRNATITVCASSDGETCDDPGGWEYGWIVVDQATDVVIQAHEPLPTEFKISGMQQLDFPGTVVGATTASLTVCRADPVGSEERVVTISGTGAAYVTITNTGTCF